ncbi:MAG: hypothetical protein ABR956_10870, partial [Terracidiphilus sp.]
GSISSIQPINFVHAALASKENPILPDLLDEFPEYVRGRTLTIDRSHAAFSVHSFLQATSVDLGRPLVTLSFAIGKLEDLRDFRDREIDPAAEFDPGFSDSLGEGVGTAQRDPQSIW